MYIIDTNILIAELLSKYQKDDRQKKVLAFYRKIPLMKRVIPDFILTEFELFMIHVIPTRITFNILEKNQLHDIVTAYLSQIIMNCTLATPSRQIIMTAHSLYRQKVNDSNYISFTDSLLLASALHLQSTIISIDQNLNQYAQELKLAYYEAIV